MNIILFDAGDGMLVVICTVLIDFHL